MAHSRAEFQSARRRFLIKTFGLGAAGLAAGGAAAWTKGQLELAADAGPTLAALQSQLDQMTAAKAAAELSYSTLQAEAAEWQSQLAAANSQNSQLSSALTTAQREVEDLRNMVAALQTERDAANQKVSRLAELVGLFDQLEAAGLDTAVENGLSVMSGVLAGLAGPVGLLSSGVQGARGMLTGFENTLPDFDDAMGWLGEQVVKLKVGLWSVEEAAQKVATSAAAGVASVFAGFAGFVLNHLPFDIGRKVRTTLAATQGVLTSVTDMTDQAADKVLLKISKHVGDGPQSWKKTLVQPLREQTLAPADEVVNGISNTQTSYQSALEAPANSALARRRALREQIANFRATHGV